MDKMINFAFMKSNFQVVFKTACTQTEARKKGFELAKQYNIDIRCEEFNGPRRSWEFIATYHPDGSCHTVLGDLCRPSDDFTHLIIIHPKN